MNRIGELESVWRYPVKSMRGEQIDPDTAEIQPILKHIARNHNGFADAYAAILTEGTVSAVDEIRLLD